jgi:hypothetical protein
MWQMAYEVSIVDCADGCIAGWWVVILVILVSLLNIIILLSLTCYTNKFCCLFINCHKAHWTVNGKLLQIYGSLLNLEHAIHEHKSSGKTYVCTKIVKLVKLQYALSGDADWNSVELPYCTRTIWKFPNPVWATNKLLTVKVILFQLTFILYWENMGLK